MSLFTPVVGFVGGSLVGASAATLLLLNGDIMGISGIMSSALLNPLETLKDPSRHWKLVYLAAFALETTLIVYGFESGAVQDPRHGIDPDVPIASSTAHWVGGFLVGLGTKLGNGCTTGHGICGLARFSKRSLVAVSTFMATAMATRALTAPWVPWADSTTWLRTDVLPETNPLYGFLVTGTLTILAIAASRQPSEEKDEKPNKNWGAALSAFLCASGLAISRMVTSSKVFDFLDICGLCKSIRGGSFDPTLATVMGGGVVVSWLSYQYVDGWSKTRSSDKCLKDPVVCKENGFCVPTNTKIDAPLVLGAATFGVGWGLAGFCPGPALFHACSGTVDVVLRWFPAFLVGSYVGQQIKSKPKKL